MTKKEVLKGAIEVLMAKLLALPQNDDRERQGYSLAVSDLRNLLPPSEVESKVEHLNKLIDAKNLGILAKDKKINELVRENTVLKERLALETKKLDEQKERTREIRTENLEVKREVQKLKALPPQVPPVQTPPVQTPPVQILKAITCPECGHKFNPEEDAWAYGP